MQELQNKIEQAKILSLQKQYTDSLNIYKDLEAKIDQLDNNNKAKIYAGIGNIYRSELDFSKAIKYFHLSLEHNQYNKLALKGIANSYRGIKDRQQELSWWFKYIEIDKKDFLVLTRIADAYRSLGDFMKAEQYYLMTLKHQATNKFALMGLGDLYYKCKNYNQSLVYWEQLLEIYPEFINILTMVGNIYRLRRDFGKAMEYYQRAYKLSPDNNYVLYGIADTLRGTKKYKESIVFWRELLDRDSKNHRIITRIADAYFLDNSFEEAEEQYIIAWKQHQDKYGYIGLTRLEIHKGNDEKAYEMIKDILSQFSTDNRIVILVVEMLTSLGKENEAKHLIAQYQDVSTNVELMNYFSTLELN